MIFLCQITSDLTTFTLRKTSFAQKLFHSLYFRTFIYYSRILFNFRQIHLKNVPTFRSHFSVRSWTKSRVVKGRWNSVSAMVPSTTRPWLTTREEMSHVDIVSTTWRVSKCSWGPMLWNSFHEIGSASSWLDFCFFDLVLNEPTNNRFV